eukprot:1157266-Pelagomonas_calceolata.AAC.4
MAEMGCVMGAQGKSTSSSDKQVRAKDGCAGEGKRQGGEAERVINEEGKQSNRVRPGQLKRRVRPGQLKRRVRPGQLQRRVRPGQLKRTGSSLISSSISSGRPGPAMVTWCYTEEVA